MIPKWCAMVHNDWPSAYVNTPSIPSDHQVRELIIQILEALQQAARVGAARGRLIFFGLVQLFAFEQ